jgi:hypothetical protein
MALAGGLAVAGAFATTKAFDPVLGTRIGGESIETHNAGILESEPAQGRQGGLAVRAH